MKPGMKQFSHPAYSLPPPTMQFDGDTATAMVKRPSNEMNEMIDKSKLRDDYQ